MTRDPAETAHVLVLGGTGPAREVARLLAAEPGVAVTSSLAGRVGAPASVEGRVRVGGFGGVQGLAGWLADHRVSVVVDATHPFAATMSDHAAQACSRAGVPLVRLERPGWEPGPGDDWRPVPDVAAAARSADSLGSRLLVTTGRQEAAAFAGVSAWCLLRSIEPPDGPLPRRHEILLARGPFTLEGERDLMRRRRIDVLVTKNSGGADTVAKLHAARELGLPVVMVARPPAPTGAAIVATVPDARGAADAARRAARRAPKRP